MSLIDGLFDGLECAICGHQVDRICSERDVLRDVTIVTAHCHGDTERIEIGASEALAWGRIEIGKAFAGQQLPAAPGRLLPDGTDPVP